MANVYCDTWTSTKYRRFHFFQTFLPMANRWPQFFKFNGLSMRHAILMRKSWSGFFLSTVNLCHSATYSTATTSTIKKITFQWSFRSEQHSVTRSVSINDFIFWHTLDVNGVGRNAILPISLSSSASIPAFSVYNLTFTTGNGYVVVKSPCVSHLQAHEHTQYKTKMSSHLFFKSFYVAPQECRIWCTWIIAVMAAKYFLIEFIYVAHTHMHIHVHAMCWL